MALCSAPVQLSVLITAALRSPSTVLYGTLVSDFQNVAPLQNCGETSVSPLCPLSPPVVIPGCLLALLLMAGAETNEKQSSNPCTQLCVCVYMRIYIPPTLLCYNAVTSDPGLCAIMADKAGFPWQRLGWLVARWGDITAGLCNNLS